MKIVALLPMKGNSERVPGKNFKTLGHKPLFRWILDTLISMPEIDQIVINTDAQTQLQTAGLNTNEHHFQNVLIRDRKQELLGDFTSMNLILQDDIDEVPADLYLMTHVTNPFLGPETIRAALSQYCGSDTADSLFSVNRFQTRFYEADGSPVNHDPNNLVRTQDLTPWYEENSCLYLFSRDSFMKNGARIGDAPVLFETPKLQSIDIDEPEDWALADALAGTIRT